MWYRPPCYGEVHYIIELEREIISKAPSVIGNILFGDMNVHHKAWLHFSNGTTPEGTTLFKVCARHGIQQLVRHPTRDKYLLDLVLTDLPQLTKVKVMSKISDHNIVSIELHVKVQITTKVTRPCWIWKEAKWSALRAYFRTTDWDAIISDVSVDVLTKKLTDYIVASSKLFVPIRHYTFPKSSHPWLNDNCIEYVARKHSTEGTDEYEASRDACTEALLQGFKDHAIRTKAKISDLPVSSKKWSKLCSALMVKKKLQSSDGIWALTASANHHFFHSRAICYVS